jgi:hypothetical protein
MTSHRDLLAIYVTENELSVEILPEVHKNQ